MQNEASLKKLINQFHTPNTDSNSYLISFEGIEGSGKSTQIKRFEQKVQSKGYKTLLVREPGGTVFGENLRSAILNSNAELAPISEAYLFASSRAHLLKEKILPFLKNKNHIVILDRYIDSSIAYQGFARGLGMEEILKIHTPTPLNILPNLTYYLSINLEVSMERQKQRGNEKDYFEKENFDFYNKLIEGYDSCHMTFNDRIKKIDASLDMDSVTEQINAHLEQLL